MKGYIALCLVIILSMGLTGSQKIDEKAAQKILENYSKNPTSSSNSDLEKAYRANCCDAPNNRGTGGKKIYLFMLPWAPIGPKKCGCRMRPSENLRRQGEEFILCLRLFNHRWFFKEIQNFSLVHPFL